MCFAFNPRMEKQIGEAASFQQIDKPADMPPLPTTVTPQKRPASTALESKAKKVAKINRGESSKADAESATVEVLEIDGSNEGGGADDPKAVHAAALEKKSLRIKQLEAKLKESEDRRHMWRSRAVDAEAEKEELEEANEVLKEGAEVGIVEGSRRLEAVIREEYEEKLEKKESYCQKKINHAKTACEKSLKTKEEKCKKDLAAAKENHRKKETELKQEIIELKNELKQETKSLTKQLVDAQKDSDKAIQEKEDEISTLRKTKQDLKTEKTTLEARVAELTTKLASSREAHDASVERIRTQERRLLLQSQGDDKISQAVHHMRKQCNLELQQETQRWEIQLNKAVEAEQLLVDVRRTNHALRTSHESQLKKVEALESELRRAREEIAELKG